MSIPTSVVKQIGIDGKNLSFEEGWSLINLSLTREEVNTTLPLERRVYVEIGPPSGPRSDHTARIVVFDLIEVLVWLLKNPGKTIRGPNGDISISPIQKVLILQRGKDILTSLWKDVPSVIAEIESFFNSPATFNNSIFTDLLQLPLGDPKKALDIYLVEYNRLHLQNIQQQRTLNELQSEIVLLREEFGLETVRSSRTAESNPPARMDWPRNPRRAPRRNQAPPVAQAPPVQPVQPVQPSVAQSVSTVERPLPVQSRVSVNDLIASVGRNGYTVEQLKAFCRNVHLSVSGRKEQLRERLLQYYQVTLA